MRRRSMKLVKNFVYATLLASILAVSASAGDQHVGGFASPSPTPPPEEMVALDGTSSDGNAGSLSTETSDSLFYEALAALLSVY
jgi:hypothetical protein